MKRLGLILTVIMFLIPLQTIEAASLKIAPMKYQEKLTPGKVMVGAVEVSNPSDSLQSYTAKIEAFRQINQEGEIQFYQDERISSGITLDVNEFSLKPQQVARIFFSIDSTKLPKTGIYGAVVIGTKPDQPDSATRLATSVVGATLLILDNTTNEVREGEIVSLKTGFWQFGGSISAAALYRNTGTGDSAIAFNPSLKIKLLPWSDGKEASGPLVFTNNQREITLTETGSYIGILPLQVTDANSGETQTRWVFAVTGVWRLLAPIFLVVILLLSSLYYRRKVSSEAAIY